MQGVIVKLYFQVEMDNIKEFPGTKEEYAKEFNGNVDKAIDVALDIRKFEIELYWKRAAYYWTFIAAAFAAFFILQRLEPKQHTVIYVVSNFGFVLSLAWYLANRGSKFWINNWETHVDYLEDEKIGPLYKTVAGAKKFKFYKLLTAYPYSVAKINQVLNLYIVCIWFLLSFYTLSQRFNWKEPIANFNYYTVTVITIGFSLSLLTQTKSDFKGRQSVNFTKRILPSDENNKYKT